LCVVINYKILEGTKTYDVEVGKKIIQKEKMVVSHRINGSSRTLVLLTH